MPSKKRVNFKAIADNSADAVVVVAGDAGEIVYCNPKTLAISDYSESEIVGYHFVEFLHPQEQKRQFQTYQTCLTSSGWKAISTPIRISYGKLVSGSDIAFSI